MRSDLYIVPVLPDFLPSGPQVEEAKALVEEIYWQACDGVSVSLSQSRRAVGSTMAIDKIECPSCGRMLAVGSDELEGWWEEFQEQLFASAEPMKALVQVPCCKLKVNLGRFNFKGFVRFCRFALQVDDPTDDKHLSKEQLAALEALLGCKLAQFSNFGT